MRRFLGGLLVGLVLGAVVVGGGFVAAEATADLRLRTPVKTDEVCNVDTSASGFQGWCVQARHRDAGWFTPAVDQVWVVARHDGADLPRHTYADVSDYALRGDLSADFGPDAITVHLADGVRLRLPESLYALS